MLFFSPFFTDPAIAPHFAEENTDFRIIVGLIAASIGSAIIAIFVICELRNGYRHASARGPELPPSHHSLFSPEP